MYKHRVPQGQVICRADNGVEFYVGLDEQVRVIENGEVVYQGLITNPVEGLEIISTYNPVFDEEKELIRRAASAVARPFRRILSYLNNR